MTNRKTTKRALLSSVLALILCFAMLLGSTWAWFTDTATTNVNTIKSGTLDVKLYDENDTNIENKTTLRFQNPTSSLDLFWEPGRTLKTNGFKVANEGNLALQYTIAINGFVGSNDAYKLTDVIEFWLVDAQANVVSLGTPVVLAPDTESGVYYLVGKMQETAGNEYQNLTLEGVTITVFATQTPYEHDANGNNTYDEGAANVVYAPAATEEDVNTILAAANANGDDVVITLTNNIDMDKIDLTKSTGDIVINAQGNEIKTGANVLGTRAIQVAGKDRKVTINNAEIVAQQPTTTSTGDSRGVSLNSATNNVTVDLVNCTIKVDATNYSWGINTAGNTGSEAPVTINVINCDITAAAPINLNGYINLNVVDSTLTSNFVSSGKEAIGCINVSADAKAINITVSGTTFVGSTDDTITTYAVVVPSESVAANVTYTISTDCVYGANMAGEYYIGG